MNSLKHSIITQGCNSTTITPTALVNDLLTNLDAAKIAADNFLALTPNGDATKLQQACGNVITNHILSDSNVVIAKLEIYKTEIETLHTSLSCETMAPLLQKAVYENGCNTMSKGMLWTFVSGLCVAVFGTLMLSLRSATLRPQIYIIDGPSHSDLDSASFGY